MSASVKDKVIAAIAEVSPLDPGEITRDSELDSLDIGSLELTEVVMDIEDEYDLQIDLNTAEAWDSLRTVGDVVALVENLLSEKSTQS